MSIVQIINNFIYITKLYKIFSTKKRVVLLYHRVNKKDTIEDYYLKSIFVSKENFKRQMRYLSSSKREDRVLITFDDGYSDNYRYAFPTLQKYNIRAMFFITINFIDKNRYMWIDILNRYAKSKDISMEEFKKIGRKIKMLPIQKRDKFLETLMKKESLDNDISMGWRELKEMQECGQNIANHTINHPNFSQEDRETIYKELRVAKRRLEDKLNIKDIHFAYPDGDIGNQKESLNILKELGYKYAFTTKRGVWDEKVDNDLLINRIPIYYWDDLATFVNKIHGINIEDNLSFRALVGKVLRWIGIKEWVKKKLKY